MASIQDFRAQVAEMHREFTQTVGHLKVYWFPAKMNVKGLLRGDLEVRKYETRPFYIHKGFPRTFPEPYPCLPHHGSMERTSNLQRRRLGPIFYRNMGHIYTIYTVLIRISCLFVDLYTYIYTVYS